MVLHKVLKLYPPLPLMVRMTCKTIKLGSFTLPKGTEITILIIIIHLDKDMWGKDAKSLTHNNFLREFPRTLNI
jgi:cytochrome P450